MKLWANSDATTPGYWHRATPTAKFLEGPSVFRKGSTWDVGEKYSGKGEQYPPDNEYYKGQNPAHYGGYQFCGRAEDLAAGGVAGVTPPLGPTGVNGELACCFKPPGPEWAGFLELSRGQGGLLVTDHRTVFLIAHQFDPNFALPPSRPTPPGWEVVLIKDFNSHHDRIELYKTNIHATNDFLIWPPLTTNGCLAAYFSIFGPYANVDEVVTLGNNGTAWSGPICIASGDNRAIVRVNSSRGQLSPGFHFHIPGETLGSTNGNGANFGFMIATRQSHIAGGEYPGWSDTLPSPGRAGFTAAIVLKE